MRRALVLFVLLAGCASPAPPKDDHWEFTQRDQTEDPLTLASADGFAQETDLSATLRQMTGIYRGRLAAGERVVISWQSDVPMSAEARFAAAGGATAGIGCTWDENETAEKDVGVGRVNIRASEQACTIAFTPNRELAPEDGVPLRWGVRSREPQGEWALRFVASIGSS